MSIVINSQMSDNLKGHLLIFSNSVLKTTFFFALLVEFVGTFCTNCSKCLLFVHLCTLFFVRGFVHLLIKKNCARFVSFEALLMPC